MRNLVVATVLLCGASPAWSTTFLVFSPLDSDAGSLRLAIAAANTVAGPDTIEFAIAGNGPHTIVLSTPLPPITEALTINGYSQPGANVNTQADGSDAVPGIVLNGNGLGASGVGLDVLAPDVTIRGIAFNGFGEAGIRALDADDLAVHGNFLGIALAGDPVQNMGRGVSIQDSGSIDIGSAAAADRNLFANCTDAIEIFGISIGQNVLGNQIGLNATGLEAQECQRGVVLRNGPQLGFIGGATRAHGNVIVGSSAAISLNADVSAVLIQGNRLGVDALDAPITGTGPVGNGVSIGNSVVDVFVGSGSEVSGNLIGYRAFGVRATSGASRVRVLGNRMAKVAAQVVDTQSIELSSLINDDDGQNPNDPDDVDTGANGLQNHPELLIADALPGVLQLEGSLDVPAATVGQNYVIQTFLSPQCGEFDSLGPAFDSLIDSRPVAFSNAAETFSFTIAADVSGGQRIRQTATDPNGNTSEFSPCTTVTSDVIFFDDFDGD